MPPQYRTTISSYIRYPDDQGCDLGVAKEIVRHTLLIDDMIRLSTRSWPFCPVNLKSLVTISKKAKHALTYGASMVMVYHLSESMEYIEVCTEAHNQYELTRGEFRR